MKKKCCMRVGKQHAGVECKAGNIWSVRSRRVADERYGDGVAEGLLVEVGEDGVDVLQGLKFLGLEMFVGCPGGFWLRTIQHEWIWYAEEEKIIQSGNSAEKQQASDPIGIPME